MRRRRIYSEEVPLDEVATARVLGPLAERKLELVVAVRPWTLPDLPRALGAAADHGVPVTVWPMLSDDDGRWANATTARAFAQFAHHVVDTAAAFRAPIVELLVDLEPPISRVRRLIDRAVPLFAPVRGSSHSIGRLVDELATRRVRTTAAAIPLVLADGRAKIYQRWMGTPVDGVGFSTVQVMAYTSLFEGYSRGLLRRDDARSLLAMVAVGAHQRFGARAGISLGAVGVGALGDERPYRSPAELADDVAIARACGVDDLALFDLRGILARAPIEPWLDALDAPPAAQLPEPTARARAVSLTTSLGGLSALAPI